MKSISIAMLFLALSLPAPAAAQGSGSSAPGRDKPAHTVTRTLRGEVVAYERGATLTVRENGGKEHEFKLDQHTKAPADLKAGDAVKVTYRASDSTALAVERAKSTS